MLKKGRCFTLISSRTDPLNSCSNGSFEIQEHDNLATRDIGFDIPISTEHGSVFIHPAHL